MEVAVFEEVVAARVGGFRLGAFAVAFGDVEHVAPVVELVGWWWPVGGLPARRPGCGKQREEE